MATPQHTVSTPAPSSNLATVTKEATDARTLVFTGKGGDGNPIIDWFPQDLLAALDPAMNPDVHLQPARCSRMDRWVGLTLDRAFPRIYDSSAQRGPIAAGDVLTFETPARTMRDRSAHLCVRMADGKLTIIEGALVSCPEYVKTDPAGFDHFSRERVELVDGETGEVVEASEVLCLGLLVIHRPLKPPSPRPGRMPPTLVERVRRGIAAFRA